MPTNSSTTTDDDDDHYHYHAHTRYRYSRNNIRSCADDYSASFPSRYWPIQTIRLDKHYRQQALTTQFELAASVTSDWIWTGGSLQQTCSHQYQSFRQRHRQYFTWKRTSPTLRNSARKYSPISRSIVSPCITRHHFKINVKFNLQISMKFFSEWK